MKDKLAGDTASCGFAVGVAIGGSNGDSGDPSDRGYWGRVAAMGIVTLLH